MTHHKTGIIRIDSCKALYFFIPKVACTSLKQAFSYLIFPPNNKQAYRVVEGDLPEKEVIDLNIHKRNYPTISRTNLGIYDYFKFGFVRNPIDRAFSCFKSKILSTPERTDKYFKRGVSTTLTKFNLFKAGMSFEDFSLAISKIPDSVADVHFRSQYLSLFNGNRLLIDFVGRFESLETDFIKIRNILGITDIHLPHLYSRTNNTYREHVNPRIRRLLKIRYKEDFKRFHYE